MVRGAAARLIVIDSDTEEAGAIITMLNAAGYHTQHYTDGLDGLIAIEDERPALVVLDWEMPFIDGPTFTRALRAAADTRPLVVALTRFGHDAVEVARAGADASLSRPLDTAALGRLIRQVLEPRTPYHRAGTRQGQHGAGELSDGPAVLRCIASRRVIPLL